MLAGLSQLDVDAAATLVEVDIALCTCMDGVILAHEHVVTRVPLGAALADDDIAGDDFLAAEFFHTEALAA